LIGLMGRSGAAFALFKQGVMRWLGRQAIKIGLHLTADNGFAQSPGGFDDKFIMRAGKGLMVKPTPELSGINMG